MFYLFFIYHTVYIVYVCSLSSFSLSTRGELSQISIYLYLYLYFDNKDHSFIHSFIHSNTHTQTLVYTLLSPGPCRMACVMGNPHVVRFLYELRFCLLFRVWSLCHPALPQGRIKCKSFCSGTAFCWFGPVFLTPWRASKSKGFHKARPQTPL